MGKFTISAGSAVTFALVNLPQTYKLTDKLLPLNLYQNGCPTPLGLVVHTLVFFGLSYLTMAGTKAPEGLKVKHSLYGALIFFFLSSPTVFSLTRTLLNKGIASVAGCPTNMGVVLHAAVYCAVLVGVMYLPSGYKN